MAKKQSKARLGRVGRVEREQRINRIIQWSMIGVVALVVLVIAAGAITDTFLTPNKIIATVFDEEISVGEFQTRVQFQRAQVIYTHDLYYQLYASSTDNNAMYQYYSILAQYEAQLDPQTMGQSVINDMIDEVILIREAKARGIEISDEEVWENLYNAFGYYPNGVPTSTPAPTSEPSEGEEDGPAPTALPLPTSVTLEEYNQSLQEYLAEFQEYGVDENTIFKIVQAQMYRDELGSLLSAGIENMEDQVWARHILVADEETANSVLERLENGETWEDLALELSMDTSNSADGGDLGWFNDSTMVPEFSEAAFGGEVGEIVGPVQTDYGFHLIEILGHEMRQMSDADFNQLTNLAVDDLIGEAKTAAEAEGMLDLDDSWQKYIPSKPTSVYMVTQ